MIDGSAAVAGDVDPGAAVVRAPRERFLARPRPRRAVGPGSRRALPGRDCGGRSGTRRRTRRWPPRRTRRWPRSGEVLLTPTRIYARAVLEARAAVVAAGHDLHGLAHITGGGLPGNVPRALPDGLGARLDPGRWPMPSVHAAARRARRASRTTSCARRSTAGSGWSPCCRARPWTPRSAAFASTGSRRAVVGEVVEAASLGGARYVEGALESIA